MKKIYNIKTWAHKQSKPTPYHKKGRPKNKKHKPIKTEPKIYPKIKPELSFLYLEIILIINGVIDVIHIKNFMNSIIITINKMV